MNVEEPPDKGKDAETPQPQPAVQPQVYPPLPTYSPPPDCVPIIKQELDDYVDGESIPTELNNGNDKESAPIESNNRDDTGSIATEPNKGDVDDNSTTPESNCEGNKTDLTTEPEEPPDPTPASPKKKKMIMCHEYVRNICALGSLCDYMHVLIPEQMINVFKFCKDFQQRACNLANCKYVHGNVFDEQDFLKTGYLASHTVSHMNPVPKTLPPPLPPRATAELQPPPPPPPPRPKREPSPQQPISQPQPSLMAQLPLCLTAQPLPPPPQFMPQPSMRAALPCPPMEMLALQPMRHIQTRQMTPLQQQMYRTPQTSSPWILQSPSQPVPQLLSNLAPSQMSMPPPQLLKTEPSVQHRAIKIQDVLQSYYNNINSRSGTSTAVANINRRDATVTHDMYGASTSSGVSTSPGTMKRDWNAAMSVKYLEDSSDSDNDDLEGSDSKKCKDCELSVSILLSINEHLRILTRTFNSRMAEFETTRQAQEQASNSASARAPAASLMRPPFNMPLRPPHWRPT